LHVFPNAGPDLPDAMPWRSVGDEDVTARLSVKVLESLAEDFALALPDPHDYDGPGGESRPGGAR